MLDDMNSDDEGVSTEGEVPEDEEEGKDWY
jgi:hypothetical protein